MSDHSCAVKRTMVMAWGAAALQGALARWAVRARDRAEPRASRVPCSGGVRGVWSLLDVGVGLWECCMQRECGRRDGSEVGWVYTYQYM